MFTPPRGPLPFGQMPNPGAFRGPFSFGPGVGNPGAFPVGQTAAQGGLKGLLAKFTGGGAAQSAAGALSQGTTGGGIGITGWLGNAQKMLQMAQSAAPIVQQYGPMVKNLPNMIQMLKAFNEVNAEDDTDEEIESEEVEKQKVKVKKENLNKIEAYEKKAAKAKPQKKVAKKSLSNGESTPKLFI
ncbi:VrrA/YqfQ family protein [Radiobacillus sp. PE A8.2]|uniref:VrrA/YqfQ family protein n=1 Tax=Radiobacillus sp. PE A8.2 TaxID=3380349 RepID=UPI00388FF2E9